MKASFKSDTFFSLDVIMSSVISQKDVEIKGNTNIFAQSCLKLLY